MPVGKSKGRPGPYSVLLLYPEDIAEGVETFYCFVRAGSPAAAVAKARARMRRHCEELKDRDSYPDDDIVADLVLAGWRRGLDPEATR